MNTADGKDASRPQKQRSMEHHSLRPEILSHDGVQNVKYQYIYSVGIWQLDSIWNNFKASLNFDLTLNWNEISFFGMRLYLVCN